MGALYVALPARWPGSLPIGRKGWRLPLWSSGVAVVALGLVSIIFPQEASSLGLLGSIAAVAWA